MARPAEFSFRSRVKSLQALAERRFDVLVDRRRHHRRRRGARRGAARAARRAGRARATSRRHQQPLVEADPRRPALPRAGRHRARPRGGDASATPCASWRPISTRPVQMLVPVYGRRRQLRQAERRPVDLSTVWPAWRTTSATGCSARGDARARAALRARPHLGRRRLLRVPDRRRSTRHRDREVARASRAP